MRILFIGDSVTEAGRDKADPADLGTGFPALVAAARPADEVVNRGVGGDRLRDLAARWQADCLDPRPDLVSVLIGINDTWRYYDEGEETPIAEFETVYCGLLAELRGKLPDVRLVLAEPFVVPAEPGQRAWARDLDPKVAAVRRLAADFTATIVPLGAVFAAAADETGPRHWCPDGVHPSRAGHELIAKTWLGHVRI
jgi:acyl-CoA thioesterase-1